ncbi:MAG: helix-turn-helix transcriptional regulator [Bacillota bacterium]|jgi:predicted transcriptional regulator YheO
MDKDEVFRLLCDLAEGIAGMFGRNCETLIQDLSVPSHPILAIYNGHVSGREVGSTVDIFGNEHCDEDSIIFEEHSHHVNHLVIRNGQKIKSTTFHVKGKDFFYGFGINYDFTAAVAAQVLLEDLANVGPFLESALASKDNPNHLEKVVESCVNLMGIPVEKMKKADRVNLVALLKKEHAFDFQKSVPFVAEKLGVSRYTIYNYLKLVEEMEDPF